MTKAAIIISAILVFAGIAAAGTLSSSGGSNSPTISTPTLRTTTSDNVRQEDRQANEAGEDVSGPCDEAEHANDPRCRASRRVPRTTTASTTTATTVRRAATAASPETTTEAPATAEATPATAEAMTTRELPLPGSSAAPGNRGRGAFLWSGQNADVQRKRTILLVEDEPSIAEPLAEAIGREGFDAKVAGTVAEALELAFAAESPISSSSTSCFRTGPGSTCAGSSGRARGCRSSC